MSLGTGRVGLYGASAGGANIIPQPVVMAPGSTTATVSWAAIDGATGYEVFTGPSATGPWTSKGTTTNLSMGLTGLTANTTTYAAVQATVVSAKGVVTFQTAPQLYAYEVLTMDGYTESTYTNAGIQSYALRVINKGTGPIYGIRLHGRNTISSHAQIKGAVLGAGSVNNTTMSAASYVQAPFNGVNSYTPPNGTAKASPFWLTDDIDFPIAVQPNESGIARLAVAAGAVSYPTIGTTASRSNHGDLATGWASSAGDYGSTPANAASNPSWSSGVSVLPFGIVVKRDASAVGPHHAAFGDSIIEGQGNGSVKDRWVWKANSLLTGNRKVVSFGRGGMITEDFCQLFQYWLANSPLAALFQSCSISGWSWNNQGDQTSSINAAVDAAVAAGEAAGKRMSVWFPTPAGLQSSGFGNIPSRAATKAHCIAQGYRVVDTSATITDVDGYSIIGTYTGDGVHLNQAGQDIMGTELAAAQSVIFA